MGSFVGRVDEIRRLLRSLRAVTKAADARVALITGAPGMGKTRLAEELGARARRAGARVAIGRGWGDGGAPPLWPWQSALRDLGAPADLVATGVGKTVDERFARFAAVSDHLTSVASSSAPLVIVLDDVHLADEATLLLTRFVLREQRNLPLLFVLTRRDDSETPSVEVRALLGEIERSATIVALSGLPLDVVRTYLALHGVRAVPADLLQALATISGGNPLHLRQLASRSVIDGDIAAALGRGTGDILARLSPTGRRIVAVAAVLGQDTTTVEIAVVAEAPIAGVDSALERARALGLLKKGTPGGVIFAHDLIRQAAISTLGYAERLDVHARAAAALRGTLPAQMIRRTHHALESAPRSARDAELALLTARETARSLRAAGGLEAATGLLQRATDVHAAGALPMAAAPLAVEHAEAVLACGRLAESRPLFERAARVADAEGDTLSLARAALGLGGIWLRERRLADETSHVSAIQRRALAALPADAAVLRARLQARLAAEDAYRAGLGDMAAALEAVRETGDPHALAEALSLYHHVLAGAEHGARRLPIAEALIAAAVEAEDILLTLVGLCWRAADLFLLGDSRASAALEELRVRAEALQCRSILFTSRAMEVMLMIRAGRLGEAEAAAKTCYALGEEVGDVDALAYYGGQLAAIRVFQGREAELAGFAATIAASPTLIPERERSFAIAAALFALRAGRDGPAEALLDELARDGVSALRPSSSWLTSMLAIVELAAARHDAVVAKAAYDALLPYADLPIMASLLAVVCFGSTHRLLGVAASTCGDVDRAIEHFAAAVTANERLGHRPAAIQSRAELGFARIARAGGEDECGRALVEGAMAAADDLGMNGLAARWRAAVASERRAHTLDEVATLAPAQRGYWRVSYGDQLATVSDRIGLHYLAHLLAAPDRPIPALVLALEGHAELTTSMGQLIVDERTVRELRARVAKLQQQRVLEEHEEHELELLTTELGRVLGLGGRPRSFADVAERTRTAVRKAIKRAIEEISTANPAIGEHLAASVSTGMRCCYSSHRGH